MQPTKSDEAQALLHYMGLWAPEAPETMARWMTAIPENGMIRVHMPTGTIRIQNAVMGSSEPIVGWVFERDLEADLRAHPTAREALLAYRSAVGQMGSARPRFWTTWLAADWANGGPRLVTGHFPYSLWPALQGLRNRLGARILPAVDAVLGGL